MPLDKGPLGARADGYGKPGMSLAAALNHLDFQRFFKFGTIRDVQCEAVPGKSAIEPPD